MREPIPLFCANDLANQLRARQDTARLAVDDIPEEQFLISSDQEIVDHIVSKFSVQPLALQEDTITMDQSETRVDVSGDPMRFSPLGRNGPFLVSGTRVDINVPFVGEDWLLRCRTSTWSTAFPCAQVNRGALRISISLPHDVDRKQFKEHYERELNLIKQYVERSHSEVVAYNESLPQLAGQAIASRRERLSKHAGVAAMLGIPLVAREGAPSMTPVRVEIRRPPSLPVPPKTGLAPEPGIDDKTYELILQCIRHQGRTFENMPATFAKNNEEDLRNFILAQLNTYFIGKAAGEVFRNRGKSDICIEQDNRAAFIGECKIWDGPASLTGAMDQLLGYLTWRDSKASLIIFNSKNKNFSKILEAVPETTQSHPLFVRNLNHNEAGEWRIQMHSKEDEGRRVSVHIFAFDLYQSKN